MYEAKRKSGNGAVLLDGVLRERTRKERILITEISHGLDMGEFVPFLQPQIDLRTGGIAGFEVLARWRHPEQGLRLPGEFLLGLRDKDLRNTIDQSVRRAALSWFAQARQTMPELASARIGINLGQQQIADRRLAAKMTAVLRHTGLSAQAVSVEILENTLIDERNVQLRDNIRQLQDMGFAIELDDFGTGNSSMSSLLGLSVSRIKIDKSFVAGVDKDTKRKHIVSAIVGIGHAFGAEVLAEGVETPGQLSALRILGCDYVQGFLLCPPMDLADIDKWLADRSKGAATLSMIAAS